MTGGETETICNVNYWKSNEKLGITMERYGLIWSNEETLKSN
ncbi:hypothetical protein DGWBC_0611 [Dehalogenimonas sp. WBC-2]|nr:hypothetical protein DGWBC_0611 [Dehalogenimonas sp. WBC-2]